MSVKYQFVVLKLRIGQYTGYQPKDCCNDLEAHRLLTATRLLGSFELTIREFPSVQKVKVSTSAHYHVILTYFKGATVIARDGVSIKAHGRVRI